MLYNGVLRCHGNKCYVILIDAVLCMVHSIGPINVCTNLRSICTKLTNLANMQNRMFYLTSRDAKTKMAAGHL